jgi:hypothetical protein
VPAKLHSTCAIAAILEYATHGRDKAHLVRAIEHLQLILEEK